VQTVIITALAIKIATAIAAQAAEVIPEAAIPAAAASQDCRGLALHMEPETAAEAFRASVLFWARVVPAGNN
jgi:hypothetical protein